MPGGVEATNSSAYRLWCDLNMFRRGHIGSIIMAALLTEVVVFVLVAGRIGFGPTLLLTFAASLLGCAMLRRSGTSALAALRGVSAGGVGREGAFIDGMLSTLGALLLVAPGFISDLIGLVLVAPSGRQWLVRRLGLSAGMPARTAHADSQTIDLGAEDWTRLDNLRPR